MNKRVLVTGGCGFIGTNLIFELLERGAHVTALGLPSGDWSRLPSDVVATRADILQPAELVGAFDDIDIVYHLAARTDLDGKTLGDYKVNFEGTANVIAEIAKQRRVERFVFYSTQLVVGLFDETRFIDESEPYRTKTPYGESKIEGEKIVRQLCAHAGLSYTIVRPTSVYGPWGMTPYREFFQSIKRGRYAHVGRAQNLVSWAYVKNLVDFTIHASLSDAAADETYFGTDFHPYTMREIVDAVGDYYGRKVRTVPSAAMTAVAYGLGPLKALGVPVPIYPFRLKNIKANYCYDVQKSVDIGYRPQYDLVRGIRDSLDWYESRGLL